MDRLMPQDPHRIGQYRLLGRLGEGGMGQVFLARSERGRTVAVKTIRSALAQEPDFRRRFALEITAAQRVGGTWTAPVLDADTDGPVPWVATGYIAGPSLHEVVGRDFGPLPERSVLLLANGLAHALRDIHGAGLIHRDLKPSNVLLTIDGPRVIDFGIARALEPGGEGITRTGATVGSPGFMSPEQVRGHGVGPASDIFCLGSLLAYATTGRTPFGALDSGVHILMFRIAEELPDLTGVPDSLHRLISGCLAKDPERRPSVEDLLNATRPDGSAEPWLPGALIAQLGRHAVELLDSENPESRTDARAVPSPGPTAVDPAPPGQATGPTVARPAPQPPLAPSWPASSSPLPQPRPVPSPYSQPGGAYRPPLPSIPSSGGFGPSAYPSGGQTALPPRRGRAVPVLTVAAVLVAMAVLGVVVALQITGDSGGGGIDERYLGAWQGEYTTGSDEVRKLRIELEDGGEGERIGAAYTLSPTVLCAYDVYLDSAGSDGGPLTFTERAGEWAVPQDQLTESCRDNSTPQTLTLQDSGRELLWEYNGQQATLGPADRTGAEDVPAPLVGTWTDEWRNDEDDIDGLDTITITQGPIGEPLLRYVSEENGEHTCTWENRLVLIEEREITLGPDELVDSAEGEDCGVFSGFRLWYEEGDEDTVRVLWLSDLERDPGSFARNE